jgi:dTDP-glucose 4,6-dehydratase
MRTSILLTGGAGFIGSTLTNALCSDPNNHVVVLDALTYAGRIENLAEVMHEGYPNPCTFVHGSITNAQLVGDLFSEYRFTHVINVAAESHVDNSITDAPVFVETNIVGTSVLLEAAKRCGIDTFIQVSTDEVYGALGLADAPFVESSPVKPSSPYSASKAAADHLVLSYFTTYGMPCVVTRCTNNYGPKQFPEKFIPRMIGQALANQPLPLYGDGLYVRDWLHVDDHCSALIRILQGGTPGEVYNIGGGVEYTNLALATLILRLLGKPERLLQFVQDRPGHDRRYAMNPQYIRAQLGWQATIPFERGLQETINWYVQNPNYYLPTTSS